ncbi:helix-turn-helix domain-containing protein [Nocardia sp. NPDC056000]|uniref:helix-turn-helix domain-containing protein n=1 Tax=Nocardia sp. NPDC056000 TaxID=3345674 RepID=UPI0035DE8A57
MPPDQHLSLDYADYPSIVIPLDSATGLLAHSHPQHQLTWVPDGVLTMETRDSRWVVQRARALWIPGGTPHSVMPSSSCEMLSLYFEPGDSPLDWKQPTVVDASGLIGPLLRYLSDLPNAQSEQRARGNAVLWDLMIPMAVTMMPVVLPTDPGARRVALALKENPADARGLDAWARELSVSTRTLSRRFRAETGTSFERWRALERLNSALPLLAAGQPISRVARTVGYTTASSFITAFRREIGTTPAVFFGGSGTDLGRASDG